MSHSYIKLILILQFIFPLYGQLQVGDISPDFVAPICMNGEDINPEFVSGSESVSYTHLTLPTNREV